MEGRERERQEGRGREARTHVNRKAQTHRIWLALAIDGVWCLMGINLRESFIKKFYFHCLSIIVSMIIFHLGFIRPFFYNVTVET